MFKFSRFLITVGLLIPLGTVPLETRAVELPELVTQCVDIEGNPCRPLLFMVVFQLKKAFFVVTVASMPLIRLKSNVRLMLIPNM